MAGGSCYRPNGWAFFEGERCGPAGDHAALRPDQARASDMAPEGTRLCRSSISVCRFFVFARWLERAHANRPCRESPGECRFLDRAAHGRQGDWQVPMAISLASLLIGGLLL